MSPRPRPTVSFAASLASLLICCTVHCRLAWSHAVSSTVVVGPSSLQRGIYCSLYEIRLQCQSADFVLAVHSAIFTTDYEALLNETCSRYPVIEPASSEVLEFCAEDIRLYLNRRCAGSNDCRYDYSYDHLNKTCASSEGAIVIEYNCVEVSSISRFCNYPATLSEGYIANPGYPSYYPELINCTWHISAGDGQTISMALLDYQLRPGRAYFNQRLCDEAVTVHDGPNAAATKLASACGQTLSALKTYESSSNRALVIFNSERFSPFRGFLLYYRAQGCPTLPAPKHGYMVYRNGTAALYMCCKGHLFNDTFDNTRPIHCVDGQQWNTSVPAACLSFEEIRESGNYTDLDFVWNSTFESSRPVYKVDNNMIADIIIPSALMASLILGNIIVMIIILKIRRKNKDNDDFDDEELQAAKPCSSTEPPNTDV